VSQTPQQQLIKHHTNYHVLLPDLGLEKQLGPLHFKSKKSITVSASVGISCVTLPASYASNLSPYRNLVHPSKGTSSVISVGFWLTSNTLVHCLICSRKFCGYSTVSAVPWRVWNFGRKPRYLGYALRTRAAHCGPFLTIWPLAHASLQTSKPSPAKQPKGTPAHALPAANTSG